MKNVLSLLLASIFAIGVGLTEKASAATPWPLGVFPPTTAYSGGYGTLETFLSQMGVSFVPVENFYVDFTQNPGTNGSNWLGSSNYNMGGFDNASTNGGPNNSTNPWLPSSGVIPMGDIPMVSTASGAPSYETILQNYSAGAYDQFLQGVVQNWYNQGYHTQYWRPGVEMNEYSSNAAYSCGTDSTCLSYWRSAFQHIYTVMHNEATSIGATIKIVWNPGADAGGLISPIATNSYWPGAAYVDILGMDLYGNAYEDNSNNPCPNYTNVSANLTCDSQGGGTALGLLAAIQFAIANNKPIAFPETGSGGNSDGPGGDGDNPLFPQWLAGILKNSTVQVAFVSIWDSNGGCTCAFTPANSAGKPNEAAAWTTYFGAGASSGNSGSGTGGAVSAANTQVNGPIGSITDSSSNVWTLNLAGQTVRNGTVVGSGTNFKSLFWTGSVLYVVNTSGTWATLNLTTGAGTAATVPSGYVTPHAASAANTQLNSAVGTIYDTYGNVWAINSNQQITVDGGVVSSSANVATLFWTGTAFDQLNTLGDWYTQPLDATAGIATTTPTGYTAPHAASPANTQINGTTGTIYDTTGDSFTINSSKQIVEDGTVISSSANVVTLFWTGSVLDQLNTLGAWYTQPTDGTTGVATTAPTGYVAPAAYVAISMTPTTRTVSTTDTAAVSPFAGIVISDTNSGQTETARVSLSATANGALSDPNSSTDGSTIASGVLTVSGTATAVATDLDAIRFTPTQNQVATGSAVTTTVTVGITDTAGETTSATSTITATQAASAISVSPSTRVSSTTDTTACIPFASLVITDPNTGQTETAHVSLSSTANGTLSDPNSSTDGSTVASGVITVAGTATGVAADIDGIKFTPTQNQVSAGLSVTTTITAGISDTAGETTSATATVTATQVTSAITISPSTETVATSDTTPAKPFTGIVLTDTNTGQTETARVSLSTTANGVLSDPNSSTDGSTISSGVLTVSGTPTTIVTELDNLVFTPTLNQVAGGSSVTTTVTVLVTDTAAQTASATSTVTATQVATHAVSSVDTEVNGTSGVIYDTNGNAWTINSNGQELENGTVVGSATNITTLFWTGTALYQLNSAGVWMTQPLNATAGSVTTAPVGYVNLPSTPICTGIIP
jgi:hypothetical protein